MLFGEFCSAERSFAKHDKVGKSFNRYCVSMAMKTGINDVLGERLTVIRDNLLLVCTFLILPLSSGHASL